MCSANLLSQEGLRLFGRERGSGQSVGRPAAAGSGSTSPLRGRPRDGAFPLAQQQRARVEVRTRRDAEPAARRARARMPRRRPREAAVRGAASAKAVCRLRVGPIIPGHIQARHTRREPGPRRGARGVEGPREPSVHAASSGCPLAGVSRLPSEQPQWSW